VAENTERDPRVRALRAERALAWSVIHDDTYSPLSRQGARDVAVTVHTALGRLRRI
jgi:hypothetical protein